MSTDHIADLAAAEPRPAHLLVDAVGPQRLDTAIAALLLTLHEAGEAAVPVLIGVTIDRAVTTHDAAALWRWTAVLLGAFVVLSVTYRFGARRSRRVSLRSTQVLRERIAGRLLSSRGGVTGRLPGEVVMIATSDAERAGRAGSVVANGVSSVVTLLVVAGALLATSAVVGAVVLVAAPPVLLLMHLCSSRLEGRSADQQHTAALASAMATDLVDGLRVLKGIGGETAALDRYRAASRTSLTAAMRAARADALYAALSSTLTDLFLLLVVVVAARQAMVGRLTIGQLIAIVGLTQLVLDPLADVAGISASLARARASARRVVDLLAAPPVPAGGTDLLPAPVRGALALEGVSLGSLDRLTLDVPAGQVLGIVAERATDAAALIDCLGRRRDPSAGSVALDEVDLRTLDPDVVRAAIVVSDHDAALFEGTVLGNVLEPPGADASLAPAAMRAAAVDEMLPLLPDGEHTDVGEHGRALSGGQRQRVALARALTTDAPVLVVRDPTTAVDSVTEARIARSIRDLRHGRTTVFVTTSPSLLAACDRVVVVAGQVTADGTHASLAGLPAYREAVLR